MNNKMGSGSDKGSDKACHSTSGGVHHAHLANGVVGHHDNAGNHDTKMGTEGEPDNRDEDADDVGPGKAPQR